jgi:hypothetical protein
MLREYLWPHCGWSAAKTGEMTMWEQNKAQISENQSGFLPVSISLLSLLILKISFIECLLYKTSDRISSPRGDS